MANLAYYTNGSNSVSYYTWFAFADVSGSAAAGLPEGVRLCPGPQYLKVSAATGSNGSAYSVDSVMVYLAADFTTKLKGTVAGSAVEISQTSKAALSHYNTGGYAPSNTAGSIELEFDRTALAAVKLVPYGWLVGRTARSVDRTAESCTLASTSDSYTFSGEALRGIGSQGITFVAPLVKVDDTKTVTYDANGGTVSPASAQTKNGTVTLPRPTRAGCDFDGWYTERAGGTKAGDANAAYAPSSDITLYAHWTGKSYKVSFYGNGGTATPASKTVTFGEPYGELATAARTGYSFAGWFTKSSGGDEVTADMTVAITSGQSLYAHWTANVYTVTFDPDGGECATASKEVAYYERYGELPVATRYGYTFDGWYTALDGGSYRSETSTMSRAEDHTLYAHWRAAEVKVNYDYNGLDRQPDCDYVYFGSNYSWFPTPWRDGYELVGWFTAPDGGTQVTNETVVAKAEEHTLYAHWRPAELTVSFYGNGGTVSVSEKKVVFTEPYGTLPTAAREGYTQTGWFTQSSGGEEVTAETPVTNPWSHTLYAQWRGNEYTVTFDPTGGEVEPASMTVVYAERYGAMPVPTKYGYTFYGWYTEAEGGSSRDERSTVKTASDHTLYAHWDAAPHTVTFDPAGGTVSPETATVYYGYGYRSLPTPQRPGYAFDGWFTEPDGGERVTYETVVTKAEDETLYARWTETPYTVSFDPRGGTVTPASKEVRYGEAYGELPVPTRTGGIFLGWFTETGGGGTRIEAESVVATGQNHTLYASWELIPSVVIAFNPGAGSLPSANDYLKTFFYGSVIGTLPAPVWERHDFLGWFTAEDGGVRFDGSETVGADTPTELFAHWSGGDGPPEPPEPPTPPAPAGRRTVSFDANGGTVNTPSRRYYEGNNLGSLPKPSRPGFRFNGWRIGQDGDVAAPLTIVEDDMTLVADWTRKDSAKYVFLILKKEEDGE